MSYRILFYLASDSLDQVVLVVAGRHFPVCSKSNFMTSDLCLVFCAFI